MLSLKLLVNHLQGQRVLQSFLKENPAARAAFILMCISGFIIVACSSCTILIKPDCVCYLSGQLCTGETCDDPMRFTGCVLGTLLLDSFLLFCGLGIQLSFALVCLTVVLGILALLYFTR